MRREEDADAAPPSRHQLQEVIPRELADKAHSLIHECRDVDAIFDDLKDFYGVVVHPEEGLDLLRPMPIP